MPIRPRSGSRHVVRQRKSCSSSSALGCLKLKHLAAFGIDPGHDVPDGAVLAASVHPLKNQQQGIVVGRIMKMLECVELFHVFFQKLLIPFLRLEEGLHLRRPLFEFELFSGPYTEILGIDFHLRPFGLTS